MFTELYLETTNPHLTLSQFFSARLLSKMFASVLFHTILYVLSFNVVSYVLFGKKLSSDVNIRIGIFLVLVMFFGFLARLYHVKEIYKYEKNGKEHVDKAYITWYFLS
jgi:hypothetical protein